jgi:hypothetical protein
MYYLMPRDSLASVFGKSRADSMIEAADAKWSDVEAELTAKADTPMFDANPDSTGTTYGQLAEHLKSIQEISKQNGTTALDEVVGVRAIEKRLMRKLDAYLEDKAVAKLDGKFMVGGDGRVKAYDEILMRAVNKMLRKYGGEDATLEAMPTRLPESLYQGLRNTLPMSARSRSAFTGDNATPEAVAALKKLGIDVTLEDLAQQRTGAVVKAMGVDADSTAETWTFRIPEKMKEEYRNSGVPFFAVVVGSFQILAALLTE